MTYKYLSYSIALTFFSFIVGMMINSVIKKTKFYNNELTNINLIKSETLNKLLGVDLVKWIVKNTPFKYFNQKLKLKNKTEKTDLYTLRKEMTNSEIEHLIGFVFVLIFVCIKFYKTEWQFGLTMIIINLLMNLNPSLLQQQNKRRIDKLIKNSS
ncbi:MAG: hypothetical protein U0W65_05045 [Bacteroidia bacterium]|nr:hypothetical protein [Bacteroidia bacterium]